VPRWYGCRHRCRCKRGHRGGWDDNDVDVMVREMTREGELDIGSGLTVRVAAGDEGGRSDGAV
jgi:hypothetical protein